MVAESSEIGVQNSGFEMRNSEFGIQNSGFGVRDSEFSVTICTLLYLMTQTRYYRVRDRNMEIRICWYTSWPPYTTHTRYYRDQNLEFVYLSATIEINNAKCLFECEIVKFYVAKFFHYTVTSEIRTLLQSGHKKTDPRCSDNRGPTVCMLIVDKRFLLLFCC